MLIGVLLFPFLEQKRYSYFPEVPSLRLTKFLFHVLSNSRTETVEARSRSSILIAAHDPGRDDRRILVCNVLPGEMADIQDVKLIVGQPLVQVFAVAERHQFVTTAVDDLDWRLDLRQKFLEERQFLRITAHIPHRLHEPIPFVGLEIVLAHFVGKFVVLVTHIECIADDDPGIYGPKSIEIGSVDKVLQHATYLERIGNSAISDHKATQFVGVLPCSEEHRCSSNVRSHDMRRVQPPLVDESDEELTHRLRRQQVVPALGLAEARKVNGKQV